MKSGLQFEEESIKKLVPNNEQFRTFLEQNQFEIYQAEGDELGRQTGILQDELQKIKAAAHKKFDPAPSYFIFSIKDNENTLAVIKCLQTATNLIIQGAAFVDEFCKNKKSDIAIIFLHELIKYVQEQKITKIYFAEINIKSPLIAELNKRGIKFLEVEGKDSVCGEVDSSTLENISINTEEKMAVQIEKKIFPTNNAAWYALREPRLADKDQPIRFNKAEKKAAIIPLGLFIGKPGEKCMGGVACEFITISNEFHMEISDMWLDPTLRGQGISKQLILAAEQYARQKGCFNLTVQTATYFAPWAYEKSGYQCVFKHPFHTETHQHGFFFEKHNIKKPTWAEAKEASDISPTVGSSLG